MRTKILMSVLSGILVSASFPVYIGKTLFPEMGWLTWVALVPLFLSIRGERPQTVFLLTFISSFIWYGSSVFWAFNAMSMFGGVPLVTSVLLTILMAVFLAAYISLAPTVATFIVKRWRGEIIVWLPAVWVAVELLRNYFPCGGFPWSNITMSQSRLILLIQVADVVGIYGLMFLIVWVNAVLAELAVKLTGGDVSHFRAKLAVTVALVAFVVGYGFYCLNVENTRMDVSEKVQIALLQGNISQDDKWDDEKSSTALGIYKNAAASLGKTPVHLVVWPEAAFPWYVGTHYTGLNQRLLGVNDEIGPYPFTFMGALSQTPDDRFYNSAVLLDSHGDIIDRYHKVHLAPFGEYVPYQKLLFFAKKLTKPVGEFFPGDEYKVLTAGKYKFTPLICYEDIFPEISRRGTALGGEFLVNVTNNAWFGKTSAPYQQLALAVFRAVENRRYMVRATNTGVSAVIAPTGKILIESGMFESATIVANVGKMKETSIYTSLGDWFAYGCAVYALMGLLVAVFFEVKKRGRLSCGN